MTYKQEVSTSYAARVALFMKLIRLANNLVPSALPIYLAFALVDALLPFVVIVFPARVLNELAGGKDPSNLLVLIAMTVGISFLAGLLRSYLYRVTEVLDVEMDNALYEHIAVKTMEMDLEHVENPVVQEMHYLTSETRNFVTARMEIQIRLLADLVKGVIQLGTATALVSNLIMMPSVGTYSGLQAFIDSPAALIVLLVVLMVVIGWNIFSMRVDSQLFFDYAEASTETIRRDQFYHRNLLNNYQFGKDARLYGIGKLIEQSFVHARDDIIKTTSNLRYNQMPYSLLNTAIASFFSCLVYLFIALKALLGSIQIGQALMYIGAINQFQLTLNEFVKHISTIYLVAPYTQKYFDYLDLQNIKVHKHQPVSIVQDMPIEFEFRNVSFRYPGSENYVLRNLSLKIVAHERLGIVGMNGSGKSTFIKLLCRLYDPTEGTILFNGVDIQELEYEEYLRLFSIVFQDFAIFAFPVGENIAASPSFDEERVWEVLDQVGIGDRVRRMPEQLQHYLYKNISADGVEVSGGEAQKLAIARALYHEAPVIILDEPTAALDPISEAEIYDNFSQLVQAKTAVYISHRLSSCRFCSDIMVFDSGEVIQRGTHEQLLRDVGGKYFQLWNAQAQYYVDQKPAGVDSDD